MGVDGRAATGSPALHQLELGQRRRAGGDHLFDVPAVGHECDPFDQRGEEAGFPRAPRRGPGRDGVGLGERCQEAEPFRGLDPRRHQQDRRGVVEVAAGRNVGQQQVLLDHQDHSVDVIGLVPHAPHDRRTEFHADDRVLTRIALADVVQQRSHDQEVGAGHSIGQAGGEGHALP